MIPDVDLFVTMYVRDETTRSSQIESTQATLADVVEAEVAPRDVGLPRRHDRRVRSSGDGSRHEDARGQEISWTGTAAPGPRFILGR